MTLIIYNQWTTHVITWCCESGVFFPLLFLLPPGSAAWLCVGCFSDRLQCGIWLFALWYELKVQSTLSSTREQRLPPLIYLKPGFFSLGLETKNISIMLHKQKCFRVTDIFRYPLGDITLVKRYTPLETQNCIVTIVLTAAKDLVIVTSVHLCRRASSWRETIVTENHIYI